MSIKIAEAHKRCKVCVDYRAQRYCPRKGKDICWLCCNDMRIDRKCPKECAYLIRDDKEPALKGAVQKAKVDSLKELTDIIKRLFDRWCELPEAFFNGRIPLEMAKEEEGRKDLEKYLSELKDISLYPVKEMARKLRLDLSVEKKRERNYEEVSESYIQEVMAHNWEESLQYIYGKEKYLNDLYRNNYITRRSENRLLRKISSYALLFSALSENGQQAMVFYELNNKYDLTIILGYTEQQWLVQELIIGSPSFYYGEREAIVLISGLIAKQELEKAYRYLEKYKEILIDSADLNYLMGLYHLLMKEYSKALRFYLTAVEIDPGFYEYKYNLALVYQMLHEYETAKQLYNELLTKKPDDINVLNNMAIISEAEGNVEEALRLLEKCLQYDQSAELVKKNIDRIKKQQQK